jgi:hypothetical protein
MAGGRSPTEVRPGLGALIYAPPQIWTFSVSRVFFFGGGVGTGDSTPGLVLARQAFYQLILWEAVLGFALRASHLLGRCSTT